jgi:uncharacterized membrane protein
MAGPWTLRRLFPAAVLAEIEAAAKAIESRHAGEIRFAIEAALEPAAIWRGITPRQRAVQVFAQLGVWDTAHNDGVLIYLLLADRDVEIVADRGAGGGLVPQEEWEACCRTMETHFGKGDFRSGALAGIEAVASVLARYGPGRVDAGNELPDRPAIL